jgi:hypothetical protein
MGLDTLMSGLSKINRIRNIFCVEPCLGLEESIIGQKPKKERETACHLKCLFETFDEITIKTMLRWRHS